jgi:hypothetical protein
LRELWIANLLLQIEVERARCTAREALRRLAQLYLTAILIGLVGAQMDSVALMVLGGAAFGVSIAMTEAVI